jgi:hypothetical protein
MTYETGAPNPPQATPTFPFWSFNASVAWDLVPRFVCAGDLPNGVAAGDSCTSTWVGVNITKPSSVGFFVAPYAGPGSRTTGPSSVRYTLDGSDPSPASQKYSAPFTVSASATVRAQSFEDATGMPLSIVSSAELGLSA